MFKVLTLVGATVASLIPVTSAGAEVVPPGGVTVDMVTINGSGCPKGSATVVVAEDKSSLDVIYSDYTAQVGPDAKPTDGRKNCQANMRVNAPEGYSYGIVRADYHGYMELVPGAVGRLAAGYYHQGNSGTDRRAHDFRDEDGLSDYWSRSDVTDQEHIVWSPCHEKRLFNINTELRVDRGASGKEETSYLTMDFMTRLHWAWRRC